MKAREIMSTDVITIKKDATIGEIARTLIDHNISGAPVIDENGKILGMVTQKDLIYKEIEPQFPAVAEILGGMVFLKGVKHYQDELKKLVASNAESIMTKNIIAVDEDTEVEEIAQIMIEKEINRIPVITNGKIVGIVGRLDIVKYIAKMFE